MSPDMLALLTKHRESQQQRRVRQKLYQDVKEAILVQISRSIRLGALTRLEVNQGDPGITNSIQSFVTAFAGEKGDIVMAFQVADDDMLLQILAPLWHFLL